MEPIKISRIISWCKGKVRDKKLLNLHCSGISIDTRTIKKGEIFIAIKGENFDGHDFLDAAVKKGAVAVISAGKKANKDRRTITVKETQKALGDIAKGYRKQFNAYVIAVTGSDGKTTTKEFIKKSLAAKYNVKGTEGNLNNHIGLPLSIFSIDHKTDFCVLEMGMSGKGELSYLGEIARPQTGIITNIASAHFGSFKNGMEIAQVKSELIYELSGEKLCLLNYDCRFFDFLKEKAGHSKILSFGLKKGADVRGIIKEEGNEFFSFVVEDRQQDFRINFWNPAIIYPALAAFALNERFNISPAQTAEVFADIRPLNGREWKGFYSQNGRLNRYRRDL